MIAVSPAQELGRPIVLAVDDEPGILDSIEDLLENDFEVFTATTGAEALEVLTTRPVAVVLSDQRMPGMSGDEFLAQAAELSAATQVLMTGYTDFEDLVEAVNNGQLFAFVSKPWEPQELRALVTGAAQRFQLVGEMQLERTLLHALLDNIPDLIYFKDHLGRFLRVNQPQCDLMGIASPEEAVGKTQLELGARDLEGASEAEQRALEGKSSIDVTEALPDKSQWFSSTRVAVKQRNGPPILVSISRDITARLEQQKELARKATEVERFHEEFSRFTFVTAHHLQEPLRQVVSFSDLLVRRLEVPPGQREYLDFVVQGAARMKRILLDLGVYLELEQDAALEKVELERLMQAVLRELGHLQLPELLIEAPLPTLWARPRQLRAMFWHLLKNAIVHGGQTQVVVRAQADGDQWVLSVADQGPGIPPDARSRVFKLFETLGENQSSGLGLALCRKIVELHGGQIWLEANEPQGTVVKITLPR